MSAPVRLFIVEDSPQVLEALTSLIGMIEGASVVGTSADAADAIRQIAETAPDAVILDIRLASGSGFEVLQKIRAGSGDIPITIVLSTYMPEVLRQLCFGKGADYVFSKADVEQLDSVLRILTRNPA